MNKEEKRKIGKKSRKAGSEFEKLVRADLESKGWIVSKWQNNVELVDGFAGPNTECWKKGKLVPAKPKFNPFTHSLMMNSSGFVDFIAYNHVRDHILHKIGGEIETRKLYEVIGVECKTNGKLDKIEKEKCKWYLEHSTFSKILIASKGEKRGEIVYKEFEE
jgi:hypothetical protein